MSCPPSAAADASPEIRPLLDVVGSDTQVPLVTGGSTRLVGLDVAATAPALRSVLDRVTAVLPYYGSVHRGTGFASLVSTDLYEAARTDIGRFVGARADDVVVITRNTTDALTLLAGAVPGDGSVVHLDVEHHANLLPWRGRDSRTVPARDDVASTLDALEAELATRPAALVALTGASNVTGEALPLRRVADLAHAYGARVVVDAAQLAPHRRIDLGELGADYIAFSGHKLYAPFGAGVLVGRRDWLDAAPAHLPGGGAVREVTLDHVDWAPAPARHEGGTPNLIGAVAIAAACRAIGELPHGAALAHERALHERLDSGLDRLPGVRRLRIWEDTVDRVAVTSFVVDGTDTGFLAAALAAEHGIAVRDGRFCAHPLLARLSSSGSALRVSLGLGTSSEDVDRLLSSLGTLLRTGSQVGYELTSAGWEPLADTRDLDPFDLRQRVLHAVVPPCEVPDSLAS